MKFDRSNKFDFCYYGKVNSLRLKSSVASKWASKHLGGIIYFAGDDTVNDNWKGNSHCHALDKWRLDYQLRPWMWVSSTSTKLFCQHNCRPHFSN